MPDPTQPLVGVYLSEAFDLGQTYGPLLQQFGAGVLEVLPPDAVEDPQQVNFALCWEPAADAFDRYENLKFVMAAGAGIDALLAHTGLPAHLPVCRVRDPHQGLQMAGFALHEILHVERRFADIARQASRKTWEGFSLRAPQHVRVAVLGGGTMGHAVAEAAAGIGFDVRVASRSDPKTPHPGLTYFHGSESLFRAAEEADFLVNVLPLTVETENILNQRLFDRMKRGGWLVQIGRGEHLVEADLINAIHSGQLSGASIDVARVEPLPRNHQFWNHPGLRISPHVASAATAEVVAEQLCETVVELREGKPLSLAVDRTKGY